MQTVLIPKCRHQTWDQGGDAICRLFNSLTALLRHKNVCAALQVHDQGTFRCSETHLTITTPHLRFRRNEMMNTERETLPLHLVTVPLLILANT